MCVAVGISVSIYMNNVRNSNINFETAVCAVMC